MRKNFIYYAGLVFVAIVWGVNFAVSRFAMDVFPVEVFVLLRFGLTVPILFVILKLKEGNVKVEKRDLIKLAIIGFVGVTILELIVMYSIKFTTLANASLLNVAPWPIFAALFAPLFTREKMTLKLASGGIIALIGVTLIILGGEDSFSLDSEYMLGNLLALSISLIGALFNLSYMPLMNKYSALRVTSWFILFGSIFLIPFTITGWSTIEWADVNLLAWGSVAYNVLICSVIAFIVWNHSMKKVGATKSNFFRYFVPATATVAGVIFFNETISWAQIIGGIVIVLGLAWIALTDHQTEKIHNLRR